MTETNVIQDATTGATVETPAVSGATHQTSGPSGPDPTGLRGNLEKNFAAAAEKAASAQNATKAKPDVSRETQPVVTPGQTDGARDAQGKFLPKAGAGAADVDEPPSSWRSETKALWAKFAPSLGETDAKLLKDELRKRENDFRSGLSAKDEEVKSFKGFHEQINPVIAPYLAQWQSQGIQPAQAIQHLMGLQSSFQRDPAGTIKWLAQAAKLDLSTLAGAAQAGGITPDPQAPLMQEINGLKSTVSQIQKYWADQTTASNTAEVQAIMDEKGADGQPLRPYFSDPAVFKEIQTEIQMMMAANPNASPRQVTIKAYENAIWKHPETRAKLIDGTEAQRKATEDAQQRERAAAAAAKQVRGGPPNQMNGTPNASNLRGMLEAKVGAMYNGSGSRV